MKQHNVEAGTEGSASCLCYGTTRGGSVLARYWEQIGERMHINFFMQVIDRGHLNTAGGYAKDRVLDSLEFLDKGW